MGSLVLFAAAGLVTPLRLTNLEVRHHDALPTP
jgi:hypothetical protein